MKRLGFLIMILLLCGGVMAQKIGSTGISITAGSSTYVYTSGTDVLTAPAATVTNGGTDTATLKIYGGNQMNAIHFWNICTKTSGTTDSMTISIWGIVRDTKTPATNTVYKLLYSDQTANSSGAQVFEHTLTGNNYTEYMVTVARIGTAAQVSAYKFFCLIR